jgi:hypothetical protein
MPHASHLRPGPRLLVYFRNRLIFYGEELLAPRPTPKLEDHRLTAVHDCLFNIFAAAVHDRRASPPSATWGLAMPWWHGTHLTWSLKRLEKKRTIHVKWLLSESGSYWSYSIRDNSAVQLSKGKMTPEKAEITFTHVK